MNASSNKTDTSRISRVVEVRGLERRYGQGAGIVYALRGADLTLSAGETVALTGPSGSGKTTLLNCILGLDRPDAGSVRLFGTDVHGSDAEDAEDAKHAEHAVTWRREHAAIVFQTDGLLPHLTTAENIDCVLRFRKVSRADRARRIGDYLDRMLIAEVADKYPSEVSGGQRQRIAIARAMATHAPLLVADEPTGELDTETTTTVLAELRRWSTDHRVTVIVATHDPQVEAYADRTLTIADGRIEP